MLPNRPLHPTPSDITSYYSLTMNIMIIDTRQTIRNSNLYIKKQVKDEWTPEKEKRRKKRKKKEEERRMKEEEENVR